MSQSSITCNEKSALNRSSQLFGFLKRYREIWARRWVSFSTLLGGKKLKLYPLWMKKSSEDDEYYYSCSETDVDSALTYVCEICVEPKRLDDSFNVKNCAHFYCIECTIKYIESKLENNATLVPCPVTNCQGVLEPDFCLDILPRDLFNRWGKALCESAVLGSEKFYCPYKDCSALLINDGKRTIKKFPCPVCMREFCVKCKVAWHSGMDCIKFQKLLQKHGEDAILVEDAMLVDLANRKKWRKCSKCNYYVEKSAGCCYIRCR